MPTVLTMDGYTGDLGGECWNLSISPLDPNIIRDNLAVLNFLI